jgi:hypothetical protein
MTNLEDEKQKNYIFYPSDNSFNDKSKINFLVEGEIYGLIDDELLITLYPLLNNIKDCYEEKEKYYILPKNIDKISLEIFFNLIKHFNNEINQENNTDISIDFYSLKTIFKIGIFFRHIKIIEILVKNYIIPQINKDNCLKIINIYIDLIYNDIVKNIFINLIEKCILYLNKHLPYFILNKKEELLKLSQDKIEEIIDRYFKSFYSSSNTEENKLIFWLIMYNRNINNDLFELLENERKNAIMNFESIHLNQNNSEPTLILTIHCNNLNQDKLENEDTIIEGVKIRLISYFDSNNDSFKLAMEIIDEEDLDDSIEKKPNLNDKNNIISIISMSKIKEIDFKSKMNFNCIFTSSKTKYLIFKLNNFRTYLNNIINETGEEKISLQLYFSRNYIFPSILYQILNNFKDYYALNSVSILPRSALNLIFKNDILNIQNEEQKLICILNWLNGKNVYNIENSIDLFNNIDWKKIKNDNLIDFLMNHGKLISLSNELKEEIFKEFHRRFQEEFNSLNMTSLTDSSMTNSSYLMMQSLKNKNNINENYDNFTFNFLSKILSFTSQLDINNTELDKKNTQSNLATNDYTKENKLTNNSQNTSKNKIPYMQKISFLKENNRPNFLSKKVNNSFKTSKILSARNIKEIPSTNKSKLKYSITNSNNSMISANNTSYISYKNNNTSIISNPKIEKNIIKRVLNNGIRANTPSNYINDKNSDKLNKEKDVKTFSIILNTDKTNKLNSSKIHSKSLDKTNVKVNKNSLSLQRQIATYHPISIYQINTTRENNLYTSNKSPTNLNSYSLLNKENKRDNFENIPFQKSKAYYKVKNRNDFENNNLKKINKSNASHLRSRSNH